MPKVRTPARAKSRPADQAAPNPLAFQLLNEVGIVDQLAQNRAARVLAPQLNMSQFVVLNHFVRLGGERSLVQLAGAMQVTKGAMTNTVARLQDKGFVSVRPDPQDGRGKLVTLTGTGRAARHRAVARLAAGLAGMERTLTAEELSSAVDALRKLREWFDANR